MTNPMIPYSFIPGTKAKASEVNANFVALADLINSNQSLTSEDIISIRETLNKKADKTAIKYDHTVLTTGTDLNNYKTRGTYIFISTYKPANIPKGNGGVLLVFGDLKSVTKQIWLCDGNNPEIFTRIFANSTWQAWQSICGTSKKATSGYLRLTNGLIVQWGKGQQKNVTYPIAYPSFACPIYQKNGYGVTTERSDTGFTAQSLTGFTGGTNGVFENLNWIAIGY